MNKFINKLEIVRQLCSGPSGVPGKGRTALKGLAPKSHLDSVGLALDEIVRWCGSSTEITEEALAAVSVLTGAERASFGKLIWASHRLERIAFECEVRSLDEGRTRKGKPVDKLRDHELKQEVISRRIGILGAIEKMGGKADSNATAVELLKEFDKVTRVAKARKAEAERSRKLAEANRKCLERFNAAKSKGRFSGTFADFRKAEERQIAEERRNSAMAMETEVTVKLDFTKATPLKEKPVAVVTSVEVDESGETKVVETKVRKTPTELRRPHRTDHLPSSVN